MMKKILLSTVAAGALVVCGAASAQNIGDVIANEILSNVLGYGSVNTTPEIQGSYRDEYGRLWVVDQTGHHTMVGAAGVPGAGYDAYGRPIANSSYYRDSDGDGVVDARDRWPYDSRRW